MLSGNYLKNAQSITSKITKRIGRNVNSAPKISVIMPSYKTAEYICETLDSALGQTFRDFEVVVINDGSPDTVELELALTPYFDDIVYIAQANAGAGVARNTGIVNSGGELIAFLDSDDLWYPDFLASQSAFLAANGYDMVYCDAALFGVPSVEGQTFMEGAPSTGTADLEALLDLRCSVITSGTIVKKEVISRVGGFEMERVPSEDFHLWLRIAKSGASIGYQLKELLKYRVRMDGLSGDTIGQLERVIDVYERIDQSIELTAAEHAIVQRRVTDLKADLTVAKGKVFLMNGDYREAADAFTAANRHLKT